MDLREKTSRPRAGRADRWQKARGGGSVTIGMTLPLIYSRVLKEEAARLELSNAVFLAMLVKAKRGEVGFARKKGPDYTGEATLDNLKNGEPFRWVVSPSVRAQFDEMRANMGNPPAGWFVMLLLNGWLGLPNGLRVVNPPLSQQVH